MIKHTDHFHGSDLETIEQIYGIHKEDIISFSANVNPLGLSGQLRSALAEQLDVITSYPDREYTALRKTIATYCNTDYQNISVGNGSTELISLFIQITHPQKALIIGPTYSEYEREISLGGGTSLYFPLEESNAFALDETKLSTHLNENIDLLVICNPNNPTSSSITRAQMRRILDICKQHDICVMVDETYVEFAKDYHDITAIPLTNYYNNLIILRGISKFFAAPGLRLGYAVTGNADLAKAINTRKNPWTINSLAEVAGQLMFTDTAYIEATKELIYRERARVCTALRTIRGLKIYEPSANFVLVRILDSSLTADDVFDAAIRRKLMIRNCSTFPFLDNSYFRICFMNPEDNDQLILCIRSLFEA
ncbi:MAG: threonine-phosphate decarboxylase [Lachnospiraceae bacterium]